MQSWKSVSQNLRWRANMNNRSSESASQVFSDALNTMNVGRHQTHLTLPFFVVVVPLLFQSSCIPRLSGWVMWDENLGKIFWKARPQSKYSTAAQSNSFHHLQYKRTQQKRFLPTLTDHLIPEAVCWLRALTLEPGCPARLPILWHWGNRAASLCAHLLIHKMG